MLQLATRAAAPSAKANWPGVTQESQYGKGGQPDNESPCAPERDANGEILTWPTQMNLESRAKTLEVSGSAQKILVYAPGSAADQLLLFPMLQHIKNSYVSP